MCIVSVALKFLLKWWITNSFSERWIACPQTWSWQDNRLLARGNLQFLGKANFNFSQRYTKNVHRPSIFSFPNHNPIALVLNKSRMVYIFICVLNNHWRENRGSVSLEVIIIIIQVKLLSFHNSQKRACLYKHTKYDGGQNFKTQDLHKPYSKNLQVRAYIIFPS